MKTYEQIYGGMFPVKLPSYSDLIIIQRKENVVKQTVEKQEEKTTEETGLSVIEKPVHFKVKKNMLGQMIAKEEK